MKRLLLAAALLACFVIPTSVVKADDGNGCFSVMPGDMGNGVYQLLYNCTEESDGEWQCCPWT